MSQQRNLAVLPAARAAANAIPEQRILDTAYDLLLAVGMRRMSMADISRRAGVSRATLYRRWPNVQAVIGALTTREFALLTAPPQPTFVETTPEAALNAAITRNEAGGVWVYDPVQERWALRPEVRRRNLGTVRRAPAPSAAIDIVPRVPAQPVENTGPIE